MCGVCVTCENDLPLITGLEDRRCLQCLVRRLSRMSICNERGVKENDWDVYEKQVMCGQGQV